MRRWAEGRGCAAWVWAEGCSPALPARRPGPGPPRPVWPRRDARPRVSRSRRWATKWPAGRPAPAHGRAGGIRGRGARPTPRRPLHARTSHASALAPAGCELSGHTRSFTFKVEEEDDTEHVLALNMVRGRRGWSAGSWGTLDGASLRAALGAPLLRCSDRGKMPSLWCQPSRETEVLCTPSAVPHRGGQGRV